MANCVTASAFLFCCLLAGKEDVKHFASIYFEALFTCHPNSTKKIAIMWPDSGFNNQSGSK